MFHPNEVAGVINGQVTRIDTIRVHYFIGPVHQLGSFLHYIKTSRREQARGGGWGMGGGICEVR